MPEPAAAPSGRTDSETCWLCGRPLGRRAQWHHVTPKSRGGRTTAPVHPICHRTIHACFSNAELDRLIIAGTPLTTNPAIERFVAWIANKDPDFNAPTRQSNEASAERRTARRRSGKSAV